MSHQGGGRGRDKGGNRGDRAGEGLGWGGLELGTSPEGPMHHAGPGTRLGEYGSWGYQAW